MTSERCDVAVVDYTAADAPKEFTRSLRDTGFAVVVNHPLPWDLVEEIYAEWSAFFDSPEVLRYVVDPSAQEGYFPPNMSETAKGGTVRDLKEFFHVYPWSVFPSEVSGAALRYAEIATEMAKTLLGWVEANTPAEVAARFSQPLASMIDGSRRTLLRVLRYPPLDGGESEGAVRAAAHEDINLLTVLPAANEPGLAAARRRRSLARGAVRSRFGRRQRWRDARSGERRLLPGHHAPRGQPDRRGGHVGHACRSRCSCTRPTTSCSPHGRTASSFLAERIRELRGADGR